MQKKKTASNRVRRPINALGFGSITRRPHHPPDEIINPLFSQIALSALRPQLLCCSRHFHFVSRKQRQQHLPPNCRLQQATPYVHHSAIRSVPQQQIMHSSAVASRDHTCNWSLFSTKASTHRNDQQLKPEKKGRTTKLRRKY